MERICFVFELMPGMEEEYEHLHAELWPEQRNAIKAAGFSNYSLFRRGLEVVAYAECEPTIAAATAKLESLEINTRWSTYIRAIMTRAVDSEGHLFTYDEVWHLD